MRKLLCTLGACLLVGCASTSLFWSYKATVDSANGALHGWVNYYKIATNGASSTELDKLNKEADAINTYAITFARSCYIYEAVTAAASTNGVPQATVDAATSALTSQSSNLVYIVKFFQTK